MDDIAFTTFIKIGLKPTTQGKFGALQSMLNKSGGGYDFYKRLKMASREVARGEMDRETIFAQLQTIKRASERDHNIAMAKLTCEWWDGMPGATALPDRPAGTYRLAEMVFGIRLVPELAYSLGGETFVTYLWAMGMPKLTRQAAGAGLYLLREKLAAGKWNDARFQIRDLREKKTFQDDCITNQSANLLQADIAAMNVMWSGSMPTAA
jgi:hypothetical protein